jgi:hypothetical protein
VSRPGGASRESLLRGRPCPTVAFRREGDVSAEGYETSAIGRDTVQPMRTRYRVWLLGASLVAAASAMAAIAPVTPGAVSASPVGGWRGSIVVYRDGVPRRQLRLDMTISSLRLGRVSARADWRDRPRCTDILRLTRSRPGRWRFSIAATIGACNGTSWIYDITRRGPRHLRLRATSNLPHLRSRVYVGTLVRIS